MDYFGVLPFRCGGSGVSILGSCAGRGYGSCGTAMLKMAASFFSDTVFSLIVAVWGWMGMGSEGLL